jgi:CheY-like chemotaxis protein
MADGFQASRRTPAPSHLSASVLIAEDDLLIGEYLGELVRDTGRFVLGPVRSVAGALELLRGRKPDAALLDYGLSDGSVARVTEALSASGVPFALATGLAEYDLPADLAAAPRLAKPFGAEEVERVLRTLLNKGGS